jgi:hypothetical protein
VNAIAIEVGSGSNRVIPRVGRSLPIYPNKQTFHDGSAWLKGA